MGSRLEYAKVAPDAVKAMRTLDAYARESGLEPKLLELVRVRASQINRCVFCIDMHTQDARIRGETEQRLYALDAWQEAPLITIVPLGEGGRISRGRA
jgi:AhpD family alkylhydroperoxidase